MSRGCRRFKEAWGRKSCRDGVIVDMVFDEMPLWRLIGVDLMENERVVLVWVFKIGFENLEDTWISQLLMKREQKFRIRISKTKRKTKFWVLPNQGSGS